MYIETERLVIRDFRKADADVLYRIKIDPQVMKFCPDFLDVEVKPEDAAKYIRTFNELEDTQNIDEWRCYAIEHKQLKVVVGCLCLCKQSMLFEYELGWMTIGEHAKNGYASEAAAAFAEDFCDRHGVEYLIAIMDVDNPASFRAAQKAGFKLFEKRTVYDYSINRYSDDYYYFRRYSSKSTRDGKFYGDIPYTGRILEKDQ